MQVTQFNQNTPRRLGEIIASGEPELITYQRSYRPYAYVTEASLFDELVAAAGKRGQEVLKRHREASEQGQQEAAA